MVDTAAETRVVRRRRMAAFTLSSQILARVESYCRETGESKSRTVEAALDNFLRKIEDTPNGVEN